MAKVKTNAMKLFRLLLIVTMVVVCMTGMVEAQPEPLPQPDLPDLPSGDCDDKCLNDEDCQARFGDDAYCDHVGECGPDENNEEQGYCVVLDACAEYPNCLVVGDCPADGNTYVDCCDVGMCPPDNKGYCC